MNDKDADQTGNLPADLGRHRLSDRREQVFLDLAQSYIHAYGSPVYSQLQP